jgi:uncharacterized Zn-binding protein involved in type VI secretion
MRRAALDLRRGGAACEAGLLLDGPSVRPGARVTGRGGRLLVAGGRVSLGQMPPLLADAMKLVRAGRRVAPPRWGAITAAPSRGASSAAIDGVAVAVRRRGARSGAFLWSFAGVRAGSRERLAGLGLGIARERLRGAVSLGVEASGPGIASLTLSGRNGAFEALASRGRRAFLAEAASRDGGTLFSARWRYRSWETRRVAAEVTARTNGDGPRAQVTWRPWSSSAAEDDGALELEATGWRGADPLVSVRVGASGLASGEAARDVYGYLDTTLARGAGRSLSVHALRRTLLAEGASASSATLGARIDLTGRAGRHALLVESTRSRRGAAAWSVALDPSGDVTLRARSRPGLWMTARGIVRAGALTLGYALERAEHASGSEPWSGTLWVRRNGG